MNVHINKSGYGAHAFGVDYLGVICDIFADFGNFTVLYQYIIFAVKLIRRRNYSCVFYK